MKNNILKNTKILTLLALCSSLSATLRIALSFIPNFQPLTDIIIFIAVIMGPALGVVHVVLSVFLSNLILGSGYWTINQILAFSAVVILAYILNYFVEKRNWNFKIIFIIFCGLSGFLYGFIMSILEVLIFSVKSFKVYYLAGIPFDMLHAAGNIVFFVLLYPTLYKVIDISYKRIVNADK